MIYDEWYKNNRPKILRGEWSLIDKELLEQPQNDKQRGLNLITYLSPSINNAINDLLLPKLSSVVGESGWLIPEADRHVTILDIIPHNAGFSLEELLELSRSYVRAIQTALGKFDGGVSVRFEGIFASPDGVTIQGFPIGNSLAHLREAIRKELAVAGLINLELRKYKLQTAHSALIKFVKPLNGEFLLEAVDKLRNIELGTMDVGEVVLNISPRYDKSQTLQVVESFNL